jgi:hypothetical protein
MSPSQLWAQLALEGNTDLLYKLHQAENKEFNVIIVPPQGFSDNDPVHNEVLHWLADHDILALNPRIETARMERALHPNME